ncbi:MAG: ATP-binding cassette domain-containing protein, partial [Gemmatimonadales bacterium]|nr:ATP-binding cassette domain-containing protein [Gemmatimonadales bacterium]
MAPVRLGRGAGADPRGVRAEHRRAAGGRARRGARRVSSTVVETRDLTASYGSLAAVKNVSLAFESLKVHALIGPSGCGKSTFLRTLNRMHELSDGASITGEVLLDGEDIYAPRVSAMQLRRRVGMVFQRPTPFPTMTIYDNVAAGLRVNGRPSRAETDTAVERSLRQSALWGEVKDRLHTPAIALSG